MGDFCVAGFHSHLPIHRKQKVVAIICKVLDECPGNCPCYLDGYLSPIAMPIIGTMGDYGSLDDWEESETTKLLEQYTEMELYDIFEEISSCSKWDTPNKFPGVFEFFDKCGIYMGDNPKSYRYTIIYEHYSIYKAMTYDIEKVRTWLLETDNFIKMFYKCYPDFDCVKTLGYNINIFSDIGRPVDMYHNIHMDNYGLELIKNKMDEGMKLEELVKPEFVDEYRVKLEKLNNRSVLENEMIDTYKKYISIKPPYMMGNVHLNEFMSLYYMGTYNIADMIDETIDWISFVQTLDYHSGHFYYSVNAGQDWHHDDDYKNDIRAVLQEMLNIIDHYDDDNEDDYDDED